MSSEGDNMENTDQQYQQIQRDAFAIRYPNKAELLAYFALIVIEPGSDELRLPLSLQPRYSDHFENFLFVVYSENPPAALISDFQQYECEDNGLPRNVLILRQQNKNMLDRLIGYYIGKSNSKINVVSNTTLFHEFQSIAREYIDDTLEQKICIHNPKVFNMILEKQFLLAEQQFFSQSDEDKKVIRAVISLLLKQLKSAPANIPTKLFSLLNTIHGLVKGRIETLRLQDSVNSEKIVIMIMHEFVVNKVFLVHDSIHYQFATRCFTHLQQIDKLMEVNQDLSILEIPDTEDSSMSIDQNRSISQNDISQQSIVENTPSQNEIKNSATNSGDNQQNANQQQMPEEFKACVYNYVKQTANTFLESFVRANTINIKKPKSLLMQIINLAKNETTKRQKQKIVNEVEKSFNIECQKFPSYQQVIVLNIALIFHRENCFRFISEKDIQYNTLNIETLARQKVDQIIKQGSLKFSLKLAENFFMNPVQEINQILLKEKEAANSTIDANEQGHSQSQSKFVGSQGQNLEQESTTVGSNISYDSSINQTKQYDSKLYDQFQRSKLSQKSQQNQYIQKPEKNFNESQQQDYRQGGGDGYQGNSRKLKPIKSSNNQQYQQNRKYDAMQNVEF
ncbi:UNKNOWN [Stylonychia lemnae]|uniref:Uncharacterized protein n=1 Tax=Stylonychia lemnae TaxID=5949 RepID=A0A078AZG8_STYLE|nr:UNKNOWN [Stylonychia lemnae]|eukprot:CDW87506.1 UNKNOWN [Stylonychia lemnae]